MAAVGACAPDAGSFLRQQSGVADVDVRMPTLEDIFVAYVAPNQNNQLPLPEEDAKP